MCLSNTYEHKVSVKTKQFYFITTIPGLHISTPSSHHQAFKGTEPRLSKFSCTLGSQALKIGGICDMYFHNNYTTYCKRLGS